MESIGIGLICVQINFWNCIINVMFANSQKQFYFKLTFCLGCGNECVMVEQSKANCFCENKKSGQSFCLFFCFYWVPKDCEFARSC